MSILIPVYNAGRTIEKAIQSCMEQLYPHIEIIVLDDASTDDSLEVARKFDSLKITVLTSLQQQGIAISRNTLLKHARGAYIAWLDADDTMLKERIDEQVAFMQEHPSIDIAGSWIYTDYKGLPFKKLPILHSQIQTMLWFKNCMIQPSVISKNFYKRENIWYDTAYSNSVEDYELWYRLIHHKKFANIPLFLTRYHLTTQIELYHKRENNLFSKNLELLWEKKWKDIPINISTHVKNIFQDFLNTNKHLNSEDSESILYALNTLKKINKDKYYRLILSFQMLRLWKNMGIILKFRKLYLLYNLIYYFKMKRNYII